MPARSLSTPAPASRPGAKPGFVLRFSRALLAVAFLIPVLAGIAFWTGAYDPSLFRNFNVPWPDDGMSVLCVVAGSALLFAPLLWIWRSGTIDFLALVLPMEALNLFAYFAISTTANKIPKEAMGILQMVGLLLLINAIGFCVLLLSLGFFYRVLAAFKGRLPELPRSRDLLDRRMQIVLRLAAISCSLFILAPMLYSGSIPLITGKEDRVALLVSDPLRATYNLAETFFPIVVGGLVVIVFRKPRRLLGIDGLVLGVLVAFQILTTDRSAVLFAMMATVALLTMEKKWPRWLLALFFVAYLGSFTFLAGFSALLRSDASKLKGGGAVAASVEEAFYGDNIIDLHDGSWVLSHWNFEPYMGQTYLGGLFSMLPSGIFPQKKEWHVGLTALRIVGWSEAEIENHFGLRISFFGESFLNFGMAGVVMLGIVLGLLFAVALRLTHLSAAAGTARFPSGAAPPGAESGPCLWRNATLVMAVQIIKPLSNSADAFYSWSLLGFLTLIWVFTVLPPPPRSMRVRPRHMRP